jgi:hypothetical protein
MGVHLRVTSLDNPMSNGIVEQPHRHYLEMLKCLAQPDMSNWPSFVSAADFTHNTEYWYLTVLPGVWLQAIHAVERLRGCPAAWTGCHRRYCHGTVASHVRELAANMEGWVHGAPMSKELEQPSELLLRKGDQFLVVVDQGKAGPKYVGPYKVIDSKSDSEGLSALLENIVDSTEVIWRNHRKVRPYKG